MQTSDSTAQPHAAEKSASPVAQAVRKMAAAIWHSINPTLDNAWLANAQIRLMRSGTKVSTLMIPIAGFLIQLAFKPWVPSLRRNVWWIGLAAMCVVIDQFNRRIDRIVASDAATIGRKAKFSVGMSILFYIAWCSMGLLFWIPGQPEAQMLLVLILACSLAGSTVICAAHPATAVSALVLHALFLIWVTAFGGTALDTTLASLSLIFILLVAGQLIGLSSGMARTLKLAHERTEMVQKLRAAQRDTERQNNRAQSATQAKSQFLSNMTHELRTPMNAVLGFSELIRHKSFGNDVDKYAEYAGIIHDSGRQLLTLLDSMLDLAKIDGGKLMLSETEVDLSYLLSEAMAAQKSAAGETRLTLMADIQSGIPPVFADERGLRQIIASLLSNAIKFTQPGGSVRAFVYIESDGRLAFGVEDSGLGITRSDQQYVFERFGKRRHDVALHEQGPGLGLALVKGFADAHDGSVKLESEIGAGTRVTVYLPSSRVLTPDSERAIA